MKKRSSLNPLRSGAAFSLVEIALSLGIIAFAFVGLMGLLPVGMANFRSAIDASVGAQIAQRVVTDLEQMEFDTLLALEATATDSNADYFALDIRYFDDQGAAIGDGSGGELNAEEKSRVIYHVRVRVSKPGPVTFSTTASAINSLPATGPERFSLRDSIFATIQLVHQPGVRALPVDERLLWDDAALRMRNLSAATYSAVITRNGYKRQP